MTEVLCDGDVVWQGCSNGELQHAGLEEKAINSQMTSSFKAFDVVGKNQ